MTGALKYDLDFAAYLAKNAEHFSTLKAMSTSPLHYRAATEQERADTAALRVGRAVHAMILGSGGVDVAVYPGAVRRGKEWDAFASLNIGKTVLKLDEMEGAIAMRDAVHANRHAMALLTNGHPEVSALWKHTSDAGSALVKCRFDYLTATGFVELKTTRAIAERDFARQVATLKYHAQLGLYDRAFMATHNDAHATVSLIAVENVPPFDVAVYEVPDDVIEAGWMLARGWLDRVIECRSLGRWPGAVPSPVALELPEWAVPSVDFGGDS